MKNYLIVLLICFLTACTASSVDKREINRLNERITVLEKKLDALSPVTGRATDSFSVRNNDQIPFNKSSGLNGRCQAITQKGTQCKRNAKIEGYCTQHNRMR